jgi:hypothetical protein
MFDRKSYRVGVILTLVLGNPDQNIAACLVDDCLVTAKAAAGRGQGVNRAAVSPGSAIIKRAGGEPVAGEEELSAVIGDIRFANSRSLTVCIINSEAEVFQEHDCHGLKLLYTQKFTFKKVGLFINHYPGVL